jgi:predicted nucleic acid-binding OB-fold protein
MKLATAFVPLRKVKPTASRWNFAEAELETAARLVLEVEGIVNPIVVRREEGTASYAVLDGNFEYYVVARAHQINPRCCESIEAFIVESRDETTVQKQIALFRKPFAGSPKVLPPDLRYQLLTDEDNLALRSSLSSSLSHQLLAVFNQAAPGQVLTHMKRIGITGKNAEKVVEAIEHERQTKPFASLKEVVTRVKGLTYEKMVDLFEVE